VLLGDGKGGMEAMQNFAAGAGAWAVAVGDFNRDGFPDLAVANANSNNVSVLLNAADWSQFGIPANFLVSGFPSTVTAGVTGNFTVTVLDAIDDTVIGYTGTMHFSSTDSQAVLPADYAFTAADQGVHIFTNGVTLKTAGSQTVTGNGTTLLPGMISWWPGDGNTTDIVGANTGALVRGATFATGLVNQAFSFAGTGDYFQAPTNGLPTGSNERTL